MPCLTNGNFERVQDFSHGEISRPKEPMEKMKEYRRKLMKRDFQTARWASNKQAGTIQSLLAGNSGIAELQKESGKIETRIDDLEGVHTAICDILEIEDKQIEKKTAVTTQLITPIGKRSSC